jgi:hypothetical protein
VGRRRCDRLRGFCGVNPLRDYALDELARCAEQPGLRHVAHGLKLHFGNSAGRHAFAAWIRARV